MKEKLELIRQKCIEANADTSVNLGDKCQFGCCRNRPIRLADVLLAIEKEMRKTGNGNMLVVASDGTLGIDCFDRIPSFHWTGDSYDLRKDSLEDQSPETVEFLYTLLKA